MSLTEKGNRSLNNQSRFKQTQQINIEHVASTRSANQMRDGQAKSKGALSKGREIRNRLEVLALAKTLGNVSEACRLAGISRDTYYRYQRVVEREGAAALLKNKRRGPKLKNRVSVPVERAVLELAETHPTYGQSRVAAEIVKRGMRISPSGVRSVWLRHGLANVEQRLQALAARGDSDATPTIQQQTWSQKSPLTEPQRDRSNRSHHAAMIRFTAPDAMKECETTPAEE